LALHRKRRQHDLGSERDRERRGGDVEFDLAVRSRRERASQAVRSAQYHAVHRAVGPEPRLGLKRRQRHGTGEPQVLGEDPRATEAVAAQLRPDHRAELRIRPRRCDLGHAVDAHVVEVEAQAAVQREPAGADLHRTAERIRSRALVLVHRQRDDVQRHEARDKQREQRDRGRPPPVDLAAHLRVLDRRLARRGLGVLLRLLGALACFALALALRLARLARDRRLVVAHLVHAEVLVAHLDVRQRRGLREERFLRLALALLGLEPAALFLVAALAFFLLARLALELLAHLALGVLLRPALGVGLRLALAFLARLAVGGFAGLALFVLALREGVEAGHERVEAASAGGRGRGGGQRGLRYPGFVLGLAATAVVFRVALAFALAHAVARLLHGARLEHACFLGLLGAAHLLLFLAQQAVFLLAPRALRGLARLGLDLLAQAARFLFDPALLFRAALLLFLLAALALLLLAALALGFLARPALGFFASAPLFLFLAAALLFFPALALDFVARLAFLFEPLAQRLGFAQRPLGLLAHLAL